MRKCEKQGYEESGVYDYSMNCIHWIIIQNCIHFHTHLDLDSHMCISKPFPFHRYSWRWMWHVRNVNCEVWQIFMAAMSPLLHFDTLPFFSKENSPGWNILWHISISPAPWIMAVLWANNGALCSCCKTLENLILFPILMILWHGKINHCHQFDLENLI